MHFERSRVYTRVCNQTRKLLYEVLESIRFEQSDASLLRITTFKTTMKNFTQVSGKTISPYLGLTLHGNGDGLINSPSHFSDQSLNKTKSI